MSRREITRREYSVLRQVFGMREQQLLRVLEKTLKNYYRPEQIVATNDYLYAAGDIPVALLAHLDTVHSSPPTSYFHDPEKGYLWTPEGLGADDRAGVFSILMLLQEGYRPSVIFLTQEEVGGKGAEKFVIDWPNPAVPVNFLVELDRQGQDDAVYYDCGNVDFEDYISSFGFVTDWGTFSDIAVIAPVWDRAAVNLSIGYFDEHTKCERLNYRYMFKTIERVKQILEDPGDKEYSFDKIDWTVKYGWNGVEYAVDENEYIPRAAAGLVRCDGCDTWVRPDTITLACEEDSGDIYRVCPTCTRRHVSFCTKCGKAFINIGHERPEVCKSCETTREEEYVDEIIGTDTEGN